MITASIYKYLGIAAIILVLLLTSIGFLRLSIKYRDDAKTATKQAQELREELTRTQATLKAREVSRKATDARVKGVNKSVSQAVASAPTWAKQEVPKEVTDALCKHMVCSSPNSVRNTSDR